MFYPTVNSQDMPAWAFLNIRKDCSYCGAPILRNEELTARKCSNPKCPGHLQHKIDELAKFFNIQGFGAASGLKYLQEHEYQSHLDILRLWFPNSKPTVSLAQAVVLAQIDGIGETVAIKLLSGYKSLTEYFTTAPNQDATLREHMFELLDAETRFNIAPPLAKNKMYVMGTGAFHNYSSREEYFDMINKAFGSVVHVIQTGARKTGVSYLLKEHDAVDHRKSAIAAECGIPVVTPGEFVAILIKNYTNIITEKGD